MYKHFTMRNLLQVALCSLAFFLCACETTGDPQQGGLFGWSQKKADARRGDLEKADADAQSQVSAEQARKQTLQGTQEARTKEAGSLQREVDRLMSENAALDSQLTGLLGRMKLDTSELTRLNALLSENKRLRQQYGSGGAGAAAAASDALNAQNEKLHHEVLALLGR
jgi:chromosome segregation ATPase